MSTIPLEDTFADILSKARRGSGLEVTEVARQAGVSAEEVNKVLEGEKDLGIVRKIAPVLKLDADRVVAVAEGNYRPAAVEVAGLASFNVPYEDMTVNYYLVWDEATKEAVAFDTGTDCDGILDTVRDRGLTLKLILLTHSHGDHIYDLDRLKEKTKAPAWIGEKEAIEGAQSFAVGKSFSVGGLKIETRSTWGHSEGGVTYVVSGLEKPVAIVGDALFAGSMGGGGVSYETALKTNRAEIFTLSDDTVVCPGHGPLTTVGEQKAVNPFYPEFAQ